MPVSPQRLPTTRRVTYVVVQKYEPTVTGVGYLLRPGVRPPARRRTVVPMAFSVPEASRTPPLGSTGEVTTTC